MPKMKDLFTPNWNMVHSYPVSIRARILDHYSYSDSPLHKMFICQSPWVNIKTLQRLVKDSDDLVVERVIFSKNTTMELLELLFTSHSSSYIKHLADTEIKRRTGTLGTSVSHTRVTINKEV